MKSQKIKSLLAVSSILIGAVIGTGCIGPVAAAYKWGKNDFQHPDPNEKSIKLEKTHVMPFQSEKNSFPSGVYKPELKTKKGTLYRASIPIISKVFGLSAPQYGGIYIPNENDKDQEHGMYCFPGPGYVGIYRFGTNKFEYEYID